MLNIGAIIFLILFAIATVFLYLAIRRHWMNLLTSVVIGSVVNPLLFMMYSLARGNLFVQALVIGIPVGLVFTALTISIAVFFRSNAPDNLRGDDA